MSSLSQLAAYHECNVFVTNGALTLPKGEGHSDSMTRKRNPSKKKVNSRSSSTAETSGVDDMISGILVDIKDDDGQRYSVVCTFL